MHHERAKGELAAREQAVDSLVRPIRDALQRTETQIQSLEKSRQEAYGSIHHQLESMGQQNKMLQAETRKLVTALRRPEVRGQWGEVTLRRLVELAGMVNHCDFTEQDHVATEDGAIRPDLIVHLPENRTLVVDVKTPLAAYLEAVEASDDLKRKAALKRHASIFLSRIRELSAKAYWSQFDNSPDFVILFVPGDQFLSAALDEHPQLIDEALRQKVILATPSSLVALLKAVGYGWRQISLAENADQIKTLAEELYERLATFSGHLHRIGKQLGLSVEAYNKAIGSLERKVLPGARKFTELGVQPKKPIETLEAIDQTPRSGREEEDPADSQPPVAGDVDR